MSKHSRRSRRRRGAHRHRGMSSISSSTIRSQPGPYRSSVSGMHNTNFATHLRNATSFQVKQEVELLEVFIGWEECNRYVVMDQNGNRIFFVGEESNVCVRQCCPRVRGFTLKIRDITGIDVLTMNRNFVCTCCCGLLCPDGLEVSEPTGRLVGSVVQECYLFWPTYKIMDPVQNTILRLQGPCCPFSCGPCCPTVEFKVMDMNGATVGDISKHWSGIIQEAFTDADHFSITFPRDIEPNMKAVLLGALFLVDYRHFEEKGGPGEGDSVLACFLRANSAE